MSDPYLLGLDLHFTPIERGAWHDIRSFGLPMLPQYPVGKWIVDFGDPTRKIGIECDGAKYHDAARDKERDEALWSEHGWRIWRAPGRECWATAALPDYWRSTVSGLVHSLAILHYGRRSTHDERSEAARCLDEKRLAEFPPIANGDLCEELL